MSKRYPSCGLTPLETDPATATWASGAIAVDHPRMGLLVQVGWAVVFLNFWQHKKRLSPPINSDRSSACDSRVVQHSTEAGT